jgi:hypothetical protein
VRGGACAGAALAGLVALLVVSPASTGGPSARPATATVGVTRTTVTVAGLVGGDPASTGAEIGAQARFARANRRGGVAGRAVIYAGNATEASAAGATAFAVVPAVSETLDTGALARLGIPFVGSASTTGWDANRFGFGFVGAQASLRTNVVSPAWGARLRSLLGRAQGSTVALAVDASPLGDAREAQARASLRAAGFRVVAVVRVPAPPSPLPGLTPSAARIATAAPAVVLLLTSPPATVGLARLLAVVSFTGTVAADASMYQPTVPSVAEGLTVLTPDAPLEQPTAATRRLAADVEAFAPGTKVTSGIVAGYWSADLFLRMLASTGGRLTRARFLSVARRFEYRVPSTIGPTEFPAAHTLPIPCGALVQSDGTEYIVVEPYACGKPIVVKARKRQAATTAPRASAQTPTR